MQYGFGFHHNCKCFTEPLTIISGSSGAGEAMNRHYTPVYLILFVMLFVSGCSTFPRYQRVTDGLDRKQYQVVGRVLNSFQKPVVGCQIYLTKHWPSHKDGVFGEKQHLPVAVTSESGDYSFVFERDDATGFDVYFDARDQGYKARYLNITRQFESELFQYTGNNPVIVNAILIPDRLEVKSERNF